MNAALLVLRPGDANALAAIHSAGFERPWSAASFEALIATPSTLALGVSGAEGSIAAFILVTVADGEAEVLTLATDPGALRQGHARHLLSAVICRLGERGIGRLFLEVAQDNAPALALYESAGFQVTGQRKGYYSRARSAPADAVLMALDLGLAAGLDGAPRA